MEQQILPLTENGPRFDTHDSLTSEMSRPELLSHPTGPTSETDTVEVLGARLSQLVHQEQRRVGRAIWSVPASYGVAAIALLLDKVVFGEDRLAALITSPLFYLPFLLVWASMTTFMVVSALRPRKQIRQLAQTLAALDDVRAVGPLIDALKADDAKIHKIAIEALIDLLPRLQPGDTDLLNAEQRALLRRRLSRVPIRSAGNISAASQATHNRGVSFRIAILQAFAQVGDSRALPPVERLTQGEAKSAEQQRIQAAARECLPLLKLRVEQQTSNQTLLRAASDAGAETLLRAAQGVQETPPDQLLRPGPPD